MKRSRYSATMSRCFGSSNQSRERKRRCFDGVCASDAMRHDSLWQSRHVDSRAEQATGERLLPALFCIERHVRGSDVKRLEIVACEGRLGDRGTRQSNGLQQLALRRVALQAPAAKHAGPKATFGVDDRAVGIPASRREARKDAFVRQAAGASAIE